MADRSGPDDPGAGAGKSPKGGKAPRPLSGRKRADAGGRSAKPGGKPKGKAGRSSAGSTGRTDPAAASGSLDRPIPDGPGPRSGPDRSSGDRGPWRPSGQRPGAARAASRAVEALRGPGWTARPTHRPAPCGPPVRRATRTSPRPGSAAIHGWWASASLLRAIGSTSRSASAVPRRTAEGPWRPSAVPRRAAVSWRPAGPSDQARRHTAVVRRPLAADRRRIATDPRRIVAIRLATAASRPTARRGDPIGQAVHRPSIVAAHRPGAAPWPRAADSLPAPDLLGPTRSSSPVDGRSRRSSRRAGPRSACWSCRSAGTPSSSSSFTPPGCASRSSRSKAGR